MLVELVFDSLPTPATVEWFFNGLPLEEGGGVRFGAGFIEIESVSLEQSGEYRVEASNIAGVGGTTLQLNVTGKPWLDLLNQQANSMVIIE